MGDGLLAGMTVKYAVDLSSLTSGVNQAKSTIASVSDATSQATAAFKQMSGAADMSKTISGVDVAKANLTLLESKVTEAREKLQTLQNAADAGQAVKGIPEAEAQLTLLEAKAQDARGKLQQLEAEERQAGSAALQMAEAEQQAATETENLSSRSGGLLSGLKSAVGGITDVIGKIGMLSVGYNAIKGTAQSFYDNLLKGNADMEQVKVGFETLLGSGQKTDNFLKQLQGFAASTPFEFPELAVNAQHMLAFGFTADQVLPTLTDIGDAMSAMGKKSADIDSVITVFGQMKAAGKVNAQDMMQITSQGIPGWKFLAEAMHLTIPEVQNLSQKGLIPADAAIKALTAGMHNMFGGGMEKQATTFTGLMSTLQDNVGAAMRSFTGPLFDQAKQGLTTLGNLVSSPAFQQFATAAGQQLGQALTQIGQAAQQAGQFLGSTLLPPLQHLWNSVQPLIAGFGDWSSKSNAAGSSLSILKTVAEGLVKGLAGLIDGLAKIIDWLQKGGAPAEIVRAALVGIGVAIAAIQIGSLIATIPALVAGFIAWATAAGAAAIATIAAALPIILIGAAIALVVAGIILAVTHWGEITKWLQAQWAAFSAWFISAMGAVGAFFTGLWVGMQSGLQAAWAFIVNVARVGAQLLYQAVLGPFIAIGQLFVWLYQHNTYFKQLIDAIVSVVSAGVAWLQSAWAASVNFVAAQWQRLVGFASSIWNSVANAVRSAVAVAVSFLQSQWNAASAWIQAQWSRIAGFAQTAWAAVSRVFSSIWGTYIAGPMGNLWNQFVNWFNNMKNQFLQSGQNFINMLVQGIKSGSGAIWDAVTGIANQIWKALGFHSPAKEGPASDADRWMPNLVDMLSTSLVAGIPKMQSAALATAQPLRAFAPSGAGTAAIVAASSGGSSVGGGGYGGEQHIHLEVDGQELTHLVMKHTDRIVRLKLGPRGRIA